MTTTLRRKRAIESRLGEACEFRVANTDTGAAVELHSASPWAADDENPRAQWCRCSDGTTLLGAGEDHDAALADAEETLDARRIPEHTPRPSGRSRTRAERKAAGQLTLEVRVQAETVAEFDELANLTGQSKKYLISSLIAKALRAARRRAGLSADG